MQNEELRRDQLELEEANERLRRSLRLRARRIPHPRRRGVHHRRRTSPAPPSSERNARSSVGRRFPGLVAGGDADRWHRFFTELARKRRTSRLPAGAVERRRIDLRRPPGLRAQGRGRRGVAGARRPHRRQRVCAARADAPGERAMAPQEPGHRPDRTLRVRRAGRSVDQLRGARLHLRHRRGTSSVPPRAGSGSSTRRTGRRWNRTWAELLASGSRFDREYRVVDQGSHEVRWVHGLGELRARPRREADPARWNHPGRDREEAGRRGAGRAVREARPERQAGGPGDAGRRRGPRDQQPAHGGAGRPGAGHGGRPGDPRAPPCRRSARPG